ncbi:hypothetical protein AJ80_04931 [Polytolypa hystricis UAMH7299]|uniref:MGS207 protein n=1 Tax=Polytolypa hystricis (strain UAMH7299) TaxID=1447883 RepID=A0A2B7Y8L6_POLH7|nr:hypothetical protein AJ80_04931 [Polytolypa hystricis UAMH7299]
MFSQFSSLTSSIRDFLYENLEDAGHEDRINLPSVEIHEVETAPHKAGRTLKHLLKLNHANYSILYHDLAFHNHMPHLLTSGYLLGGDSDHLNKLYEVESKDLEEWVDSPGEIPEEDWREYLGKKEYQRAFVDFFEDELVRYGYDWEKVVGKYLYSGKQPLINSLLEGLGHPLIHLGYAFEISNREVAMEALAMAATGYGDLHKFFDEPSYVEEVNSITPKYSTTSPLEILNRIHADKRFNGIFKHPGAENINILLRDYKPLVIAHWNAWNIIDPKRQFEDSQHAAAAVFTASTAKPNDFFLVHLLTSSHAVRILLPFVPARFHVSLVRQWFLLTIAVYIAQLRPEIKPDTIKNHDLKGRNWAWVDEQGVRGKRASSVHYIKALRALKEAANTWGDEDEFYLKAAVKFADQFDGWGGFGP